MKKAPSKVSAKKTTVAKGPKKAPARTPKTAAKKAAPKRPTAKRPSANVPRKAAVRKGPTAIVAPPPEAKLSTPTEPTTYVAIVLDRSGSMSGIRKPVVASCNQQMEAIKINAALTGQKSYASLYTFHSVVDKPRFFVRAAEKLVPMDDKTFRLGGATALLDGVGTASAHLSALPGADSEHTSFLIITITDGFENSSRVFKKTFREDLAKYQATGRWSFVFMCPKSGVKTLRKFGVPEGNIAEWKANQKGAEQLGTQVSQGLQSFYEARKDGQRAVSKFFVTDLSSVSTAEVSGTLEDLSSKFERWTLKAGGAIRVVVEDILKKDKKAAAIVGTKYQTGRAYYELTKPETVQARKRMVILNHKTGAIYGGGQARRLLGFPEGESCKVKPGNHGDFAVFVESTSVNRVLVAKTTLLYSHGG